MLDLYLCLVVEVLNEAIWMVILLLVERNKEREVGPVPILLIAHVVTNSVKSSKKMYFYGTERKKKVITL